MIFRYVLMAILLLFLVYVCLLRHRAVLRKGISLTLTGTILTFSFKPEWSTVIAHYLGVGRGVDLMFYVSQLFLLLVAFLYYLRFKDMEARFTKLVRRLALDAAPGGSGRRQTG